MLGIRPAAGRFFDDGDDAVEGASPVCVISYRLWRERFAADPAVVGRKISLGGTPFQIVGVGPRGFAGASLHAPRDLQVPSAMVAAFYGDKREVLSYELLARVKPGVGLQQAAARLNAVGQPIERVYWPTVGRHDDLLLRDGSQGVSSDKEQMGKPVLVLAMLVGVLLLVACANVAALLLVRSVERTREAGMRLAIGASRAVLFRQFLAEAALLAGGGGIAGWVLGLALLEAILRLLPNDPALAALVRPNPAVFGFSAFAALAAGLLFGVLPAWRASRADPLPAIHGASLARPGKHSRFSGAVIAAQIALSLALLFSAGLFTRTLRNLRAVDLGFRPENLVTMAVDVSHTAFEKHPGPFFEELLRRARELPETRAASLASINIVTGAMTAVVINAPPGYVAPNGLRPTVYITDVSDGYFRTLGTPLVSGADFSPGDGDDVVIVNEQFAREFFAGNALGKSLSYPVRGGGVQQVRIVGIARTAKFRFIREEPHPVMYRPYTPDSSSRVRLNIEARTTGDPARSIERLRAVFHALAPGLPPMPATTMEMQIDEALSRERLLAFLSTLLGAVAGTLAAIGLYGVLSFAVTRRTREIGIRLSIGAQRSAIVALFLRESAWMLAAGVVAGVPLMLACGKLAASLLYGLRGQDGMTLGAAVAALGLVALAAAAIPAARAARTDPMRALRHE
jgi:predicted permease